MNFCGNYFIGKAECLFIELSATNNAQTRVMMKGCDGGLQTWKAMCSLCLIVGTTGNDEVFASRQWFTNRLPSFTSHNNRLAHGCTFKMGKIRRQFPRQVI